MKKEISVIIIWFAFIGGAIGGAVKHEKDMRNEYDHDKSLTHTSWVTEWPKETPK